MTIKEVADLMNAEYEIVDEPRDEGDTLTLIGNKEPLQKVLNWVPKYNVKESIKEIGNDKS